MRAMIQQRFEFCRLRLNEEKTKIVYCKSSRQKECYPNVTFDFLGFAFQPWESVDKYGNRFTGFLPAISRKSMKRINETIRSWHLNRPSNLTLEHLASDINSIVRGWMTYYGKFYPTRLKWFMQTLNGRLARWVMCKFERYRHRFYPAQEWLARIAEKEGLIFYYWKCGVLPRFTNKEYEYTEYHPARVVRHIYEVVRVAIPDGETIVSSLPEELRKAAAKGCPFDARMMAFILCEKYAYHSPINTVKKKLRDMGAVFSKTTLNRYYHMGLEALRDCLDSIFKREIYSSNYLLIDETCELVGVKNENGGISYKKRYLWAFLDKAKKLVHYVYEKGSRGLSVVEDYLKD